MSVRKLPCAYQLGTVVYLRMSTEATPGMVTEATPGMVTEAKFCVDGGLLYGVAWGNSTTTFHYELELSTVRSFEPAAPAQG